MKHRTHRAGNGTRVVRGALIASAAALVGSPAAASDFRDFRLAIIHDALLPRTPVARELIRSVSTPDLKVGPTSDAQGTTSDAQGTPDLKVGAPSLAQSGSPVVPEQSNAQPAPTYALSIPGGAFRDVALALAAATGNTVTIAVDSIAPIYSPGVTGRVTFEQALKAITAGTDIAFRLAGQTAVLQLPAMSEAVSVTAGIPTVASPKYSAPLRDIPQTIEVIPRAAMESQGATTLSEALRNVPGVTLQAGEGGGASNTAGDMFNLRGFNASNSLFVDNVRDDGLVSRDVFNIEQIEVFMGPTGADVGRGTAAGYVNMQTKTPRLPRATSAALTFGNANQRRTTLDLNQPLSVGDKNSWIGKSAARLNVLWQDSGVAGRNEASNATQAVAPSIGLGLETRTRVLASAQILRQDNVPDYGIPGAAWHEDFLAPTTVHTTKPVDQSNYYGSPDVDYDRSEQNTFTARVEHDVAPRWMVSNQTRYNQTHREAVISTVQNVASYVPETDLVTIARQGNERENEIASNQTNLTGRLTAVGLQHNISSGLEFAREAQFTPTLTGVGTRAPVNIYTPNPQDPVTGFAPSRTAAYTKGHTTTAALFLFDSMPVGTRVQVNAGLRWEHYDTEFRSIDASNATTVQESGADGLFSGKAGVVVRATRNGNLYASYGTTVTPPGASNFTLSSAVNNQNNPNVKPQESSNLEVGTKWDVLGGRLGLNAAVFHTINENVIFTVDAAAVPPVFNQDDKQRVDGVSIGATGHVTPEWEVLASFGYLDTENLSQNIANNGKQLTLAPKYSGSLWNSYRLPKGWTIGGGVRATDKVFINAANTIVAPRYYVVDGLVEYAVNSHLTLRLNVYNLTDEVYIRNVNNNGGRYNPGNPRTAQLTTVVTF